jgi:hypothetical protein
MVGFAVCGYLMHEELRAGRRIRVNGFHDSDENSIGAGR